MISNGSDGLLVLTSEGHDYNDDDEDDNGDDDKGSHPPRKVQFF